MDLISRIAFGQLINQLIFTKNKNFGEIAKYNPLKTRKIVDKTRRKKFVIKVPSQPQIYHNPKFEEYDLTRVDIKQNLFFNPW